MALPNNIVIHSSERSKGYVYFSSNVGVFRSAPGSTAEQISGEVGEALSVNRSGTQIWLLSASSIKLLNISTGLAEESYLAPRPYTQTGSNTKSCKYKNNVIFYNFNNIVIFNTLSHVFTDITRNNGLLSNGAQCITIDREQNIWIGHASGVSKITNLDFRAYTNDYLGLPEDEVSLVYKADNNTMVLGSNSMIMLKDPAFNTLNSFNLYAIAGRRDTRTMDATSDGNTIYVPYLHGLACIQNNSSLSIKETPVCNAVTTNKGNLFYNSRGKLFHVSPGGASSVIEMPAPTYFIRKIFKYNDSTLIVCAVNGAYETTLGTVPKFKKIINNSSFAYVYDPSRQIEYFGTRNGLYSRHNNELTHLEINKEPDLQVYALVMDKNDDLWIGTSNGIFLYQNNKRFIKLNNIFSIRGLEANRSAMQLDGDCVWVGTNSGLNKIPINFNIPQYIPPCVIESVISNKRAIDFKSNNELSADENEVTFKFCLNSFVNENENSFSYQLEGLDNAWSKPNPKPEVRFSNLPPGNYTFRVKAWNVFGKPARIAEYSFVIRRPFWQSLLFYIMVAVLALLAIWLIVKWRVKVIERKLRNKQQLSESELKALRAQINPHYLSNSLQSLQNLILDKRTDEAINILGQYGKVMRNILYNSEKQFIPLHTEIDTLKQYMELESLRYGYEYVFTIKTEGINDALLKAIQIPSMLIQPFIENAIIHGLMRKKNETRELYLQFSYEGTHLICAVIDNGIGRRNTQQKQSNRKSLGNKNVEERFKLYGKLLNMKTEIEVQDLTDENGNAKGTKVILTLPYKLIYD